MVQFGESQSTIAKYVGVSQPTISKELSRNSMIKGKYKKKRYYAPKKAQWKADSRKHRFVLPRKFDKEMAHYVYERLVYHEWSPEQIVGTAKTEGRDMVSVERIYQYIRMDRAANGNVYKHCRHKLKHRRRVLNASASNIPNRVSIHSRPSEVEKRERVGDWEMDLIQGINGTF
ncbi:MAG: IS30 family transposase, partial [Bacteroidales bacterium]|nr:IS30 family transposase [Bacteroidales bacterium]